MANGHINVNVFVIHMVERKADSEIFQGLLKFSFIYQARTNEIGYLTVLRMFLEHTAKQNKSILGIFCFVDLLSLSSISDYFFQLSLQLKVLWFIKRVIGCVPSPVNIVVQNFAHWVSGLHGHGLLWMHFRSEGMRLLPLNFKMAHLYNNIEI